jgi:hypothetical protein
MTEQCARKFSISGCYLQESQNVVAMYTWFSDKGE